jgi:hypothetical protein
MSLPPSQGRHVATSKLSQSLRNEFCCAVGVLMWCVDQVLQATEVLGVLVVEAVVEFEDGDQRGDFGSDFGGVFLGGGDDFAGGAEVVGEEGALGRHGVGGDRSRCSLKEQPNSVDDYHRPVDAYARRCLPTDSVIGARPA